MMYHRSRQTLHRISLPNPITDVSHPIAPSLLFPPHLIPQSTIFLFPLLSAPLIKRLLQDATDAFPAIPLPLPVLQIASARNYNPLRRLKAERGRVGDQRLLNFHPARVVTARFNIIHSGAGNTLRRRIIRIQREYI